MSERLFVSGAGAVTFAGLGLDPLRKALNGEVPFATEEPIEGLPIQVGRVGRLNDDESASSYRRWGQLDTYSRYGFVAARLALHDADVEPDSPGRADMGVLLGTAFGCMEENQRFDRYNVVDGVLKGASPLLFKGTVDNAPAGWIAVAWKLQGPNATFVSGDGAALEALWSAEGLLKAGRATGLLVGGVERFVDLHHLLRVRDESRQGEVLSEGAGVVLLEREDSLRARGEDPRLAHAELIGVAREHGTIEEALGAAYESLGIDASDVGLLTLATPDGDKATIGESHGAWGGIALCVAVARRDGDWGGHPLAVVHAFGEGDEHFFAVLKDPREES